ncbi:unnamed protein product [Darwinula stevensoni]|uniref:C-type lectin domain-containing protein n=1 Tax=Darwinula stevensoni TaxID=69355 RepID=A0A7R9A5C0_9CRUS|nr:unnamed protein product [Darwinula stevensoni]CAG0886138.1 unnamed protein product [Darwinula stevensoni]
MERLRWLIFLLLFGENEALPTARFYPTKNNNMKITSPTKEFVIVEEMECAFSCSRETTCLSFSTTKSAGAVTCRFGDAYDARRTADPGSKFFYKEPVTTGYTPVPGTSSFLKLVRIDGLTWIEADAKCRLDVGGRLAIPATTEMLNSMNQTMIANLGVDIVCKYFFMDGQSKTNQYTWSFLDGTSLNITAKGDGNFHPNEPDSGSGGQCLMMTRQYAVAPFYSGFWVDSSCTSGVVQFGCVSDGYFCEIKIPN